MKTVKLGEVLESRNTSRRPIKATDRNPGITPYLGASGVVDHVDGYTHEGIFLCLSEDGQNLRSRKTPIAWVQEGKFWANNHLHVFSGHSKNELKFFQYAIEAQTINPYLTGSTQPKLTKLNAMLIEVPGFSKNVRSSIGAILGSLDDKIASNQSIISRSKELSKILADKSSGTCNVGDLATIHKSPIGVNRMSNATVTHYSLPAFDKGMASKIEGETIKSGKNLLDGPVVLVSKLNPRFPRIWGLDSLPEGVSVASTEFVALKPKLDISISQLWAVLESAEFTKRVLERVTGTTGSHQRIRPEAMMEIEVKDPRTLTDEMKNFLDVLLRSMNHRVEENQRLAQTRDELLPLLMDGRITVKDAERVAEEV